ncbi:hypothetical protein [Clostridium oryzae]|uniref:Uncharacterized protein n=1 Tax=Clostridium oryzae TaxID=1450648 RepID=A0A1V4IHY3_9CLOT|nr:hypothetical protein [Clostridium oryzae]OPJ59434.1 hypothetical protein CLORY_32760 [Clostridium oryzae]
MSCCGCYSRQATPVFIVQQPANCMCNFPTLVILILIILQFSKSDKHDDDYLEDGDYYKKSSGQKIDNSILFIITLFFLSCGGCGNYYRYY